MNVRPTLAGFSVTVCPATASTSAAPSAAINITAINSNQRKMFMLFCFVFVGISLKHTSTHIHAYVITLQSTPCIQQPLHQGAHAGTLVWDVVAEERNRACAQLVDQHERRTAGWES